MDVSHRHHKVPGSALGALCSLFPDPSYQPCNGSNSMTTSQMSKGLPANYGRLFICTPVSLAPRSSC